MVLCRSGISIQKRKKKADMPHKVKIREGIKWSKKLYVKNKCYIASAGLRGTKIPLLISILAISAGLIWQIGYCIGGNFNIQIWAWSASPFVQVGR